MKHDRLENMIRGWFVGNFDPSVLKTTQFEVSIRSYAAGEREASHYHKIAVELTAVVSGRVRMMGRDWEAGDIVTIEPGEATSFEAITEAVTVVVKSPSASEDKYLVGL